MSAPTTSADGNWSAKSLSSAVSQGKHRRVQDEHLHGPNSRSRSKIQDFLGVLQRGKKELIV